MLVPDPGNRDSPARIEIMQASTVGKCEYAETIYFDAWGQQDHPPYQYVLIGRQHIDMTWDCTPIVAGTFQREPSDGRPPRALLDGLDFSKQGSGGSTTIYQGYLIGYVGAPALKLDKELLERSTFLAHVPVSDQFTAKLTWNSPDPGP